MSAPEGNKYAIGNSGGRPPIFNNAQELATACNEYFEYIKGESRIDKDPDSDYYQKEIWERRPEPATITGLTLYLGFANRQSLSDYEKKEEYSDIIKRAKTRVEHEYEKSLLSKEVTGSIFALKNMGWRDKTEQEITVPQGLTINYNKQPGNEPLTNGS